MGSGTYSSHSWANYTSLKSSSMGVAHAAATVDQIFDQRAVSPNLDPKGVTVRESRDSDDNPKSTPLIVALDVTGSMGRVLGTMAKQGLDKLMNELYNRKPITDPHLMVMGIGDAEAGDQGPLQVTQFEADVRIAQQLEQIWLERGGGGNTYESYALAWYFAAYHTATDSFEKRGKKGFLFTVGDEKPTPYLRPADIRRVIGGSVPTSRKLDAKSLFEKASEKWEVFHLIVAEGSHKEESHADWAEILGQRAIVLRDHKKMAEVIVSTLQLANGMDYDEVQSSWDSATAAAVSSALNRGITFGGVPTA